MSASRQRSRPATPGLQAPGGTDDSHSDQPPRPATIHRRGRPAVRRLRNQRGLPQEQLADRAGISPATVARLERRPAAPCRTRTLGRLAAALDEEPARLTPP
ncbi:MAG TPA: helix-turn-helix domain-containing protein [Streptosporangiaceae bacterium]|nr:helix-turn-helix domain-containing protein [Streptosporangiaceae bacterium]